MTLPVTFNVSLTNEQQQKVLNHPPVKQWMELNYINGAESCTINHVDWFGSNVGFVNGSVTRADKVPGIGFLRSDAVCGLIVFRRKGIMKYFSPAEVLLTRENRTPIGGMPWVQAAAGMIDSMENKSQANLKVKLLEEISEETGLDLSNNKITYVASEAPSAGGCSEVLHLYIIEVFVTKKELEAIKDCKGVYGAPNSGEKITRVICELRSVFNNKSFSTGAVINGTFCGDMKTVRLAMAAKRWYD